MKTIIAGSRIVNDYKLVCKAISLSGFADQITEVVSGGANGVDKCGEIYAESHNLPCKIFPAKWDDLTTKGAIIRKRKDGSEYNLLAGYTRNTEMAKYADALIAITKDGSKGTSNMIKEATDKGLKIYVYEI
jgi:hypothetical protein